MSQFALFEDTNLRAELLPLFNVAGSHGKVKITVKFASASKKLGNLRICYIHETKVIPGSGRWTIDHTRHRYWKADQLHCDAD